jgi:hypothetical protein
MFAQFALYNISLDTLHIVTSKLHLSYTYRFYFHLFLISV